MMKSASNYSIVFITISKFSNLNALIRLHLGDMWGASKDRDHVDLEIFHYAISDKTTIKVHRNCLEFQSWPMN